MAITEMKLKVITQLSLDRLLTWPLESYGNLVNEIKLLKQKAPALTCQGHLKKVNNTRVERYEGIKRDMTLSEMCGLRRKNNVSNS